jgi:hypothetical protein
MAHVEASFPGGEWCMLNPADRPRQFLDHTARHTALPRYNRKLIPLKNALIGEMVRGERPTVVPNRDRTCNHNRFS